MQLEMPECLVFMEASILKPEIWRGRHWDNVSGHVSGSDLFNISGVNNAKFILKRPVEPQYRRALRDIYTRDTELG